MTVAGFQFGLLTICANHDPSVNQLLPPLTIREDEAAEVLQIPERMVTWLAKRL